VLACAVLALDGLALGGLTLDGLAFAGRGPPGRPDLTLGNDDLGAEPGRLSVGRPAAAHNRESGTIEARSWPEAKSDDGMPAQLTALELSQAVPPLRTWCLAQGTFDNAAMPGNHPAAQRQPGHPSEYCRSDNQRNGESELSYHPRLSRSAVPVVVLPLSSCRAGLTLSRCSEQGPVIPHVSWLLRTSNGAGYS
jgi:hypothetical protein